MDRPDLRPLQSCRMGGALKFGLWLTNAWRCGRARLGNTGSTQRVRRSANCAITGRATCSGQDSANMPKCGCGCGLDVDAEGQFAVGHDQKLRTSLERMTGGLLPYALSLKPRMATSKGHLLMKLSRRRFAASSLTRKRKLPAGARKRQCAECRLPVGAARRRRDRARQQERPEKGTASRTHDASGLFRRPVRLLEDCWCGPKAGAKRPAQPELVP